MREVQQRMQAGTLFGSILVRAGRIDPVRVLPCGVMSKLMSLADSSENRPCDHAEDEQREREYAKRRQPAGSKGDSHRAKGTKERRWNTIAGAPDPCEGAFGLR